MALGMAITGGSMVYADDVFQTVSTYLTNDVKIEYNGETQTLPSGYNILNYDSRTYVPLRYVSELLGADVDWDNDTRSVIIKQEQPSESENNGNSENTENNGNNGTSTTPQIVDRIDTTATGIVPQAVETIDYRVLAKSFSDDRERERSKGPALYLQIVNKHDNETMALRAYKTQIVVNGEKTYNYATDVDDDYKDKTWDREKCDMEGGESSNVLNGYIRLPKAVQTTDIVDVTVYLYYGVNYDNLIPVTLHLDMNRLSR